MSEPWNSDRTMPADTILLSIVNPDGCETLGVKTGESVLDVRRAAAILGIAVPSTLDALLKEQAGARLAQLLAAADAKPAQVAEAIVPESAVTHGRLFQSPEKIVCVGANYRAHANEIGIQLPKAPILFAKFANALAPHLGTVRLPRADVATKFDYETELTVVIGREARDISKEDAPGHIAGYCIANDVSARDLQMETGGQWMSGKALDDFAPIGPYFVSADRVGNPHELTLETLVNGERRQIGNTSDLIFDCYTLVSYISRLWTLKPGDIILTGTPPGVIAGYPKDKQVWLKAGDQIESRIEKLGSLRFRLA